jgi:cytosine/adenosine deaminase-related metal-dependent hydrolase
MLERAMLVGLRNNFRRDEEVELAFHVCTQGGADVMRLDNYGLRVGAKADLIVVDGEAITQAVAARPARRMVIKHGKVVARNGTCVRAAP